MSASAYTEGGPALPDPDEPGPVGYPWGEPWADPVASATLAWLDAQISGSVSLAAGALPNLGSPGWLALTDTDPAKLAAILAAARAWFREGVELPVRLWEQLECERAARYDIETEEFAAVSRQVRASANHPTVVEIQRRRTTYDRPALSPEQIRAQARASIEAKWGPLPDGQCTDEQEAA